MQWNNELEIGVPKVDEQHKELFRRVNSLLDAGKDNRAQEMLSFLAEYVLLHFHDEEVLQVESEYPGYEEHKKEHERFIEKFKELKKKYDESGENLDMLMSINNVVTDWLFIHIMGEDKKFAKYYRKKMNV